MNRFQAAAAPASGKFDSPAQHFNTMDVAAMTPPSQPNSPNGRDYSKVPRNHPAPTLVHSGPTPPPEPVEAAQQSSRSYQESRDNRLPSQQATQNRAPVAPMRRQQPSQLMPPPPSTPARRSGPQSESRPTRSPASAGEDWADYTDPSLRTNNGIPSFKNNPCISRNECRLNFGNATSPTTMIGLPFGSVIEFANDYRGKAPNEDGT